MMKSKQHFGFTLVELVVVILLVGIISVFVLPRFFASNVFVERRVKDELISALRYTQQLSMNRGEDHRLQINAANYTFHRDAAGTWPQVTNPDGSGVTANNFPNGFTVAPTTITFNRLGQPTPNGLAINIGAGETVTIEADTGYAH